VRGRMKTKYKFNMCIKKKDFSKIKAFEEAERLDQKPYHCPICKKWHLSTKFIKPPTEEE
jgi:hypothetical protein